ncbi:tRNA (adenosine(37)-N6)-dimethylallyltransferase MiaA [Odoribacter sp. OttesenSCG-928-L07]|nr:tRNA (adenosine(37)-N6)-dimethylallyltransferase MiaA [Odoribacter sp. OttesenSCG-928-L07]MDL2240767.1 tRNA (adenosine(37)-N6)-dimethylallyltransferase MiaA [Bacteroidales bacterium OttesenSCG-928-K22]
MMMICTKPTLIVVTGPTASGKTSTAIKLAKELNCEIISSDSRQFYKEMKIGTAVPSVEELNSVKHHFVGNLSIHENYNVSKYEEEVLATLDKLFAKNNFAILCGGSGLYIDAVVNGVDYFPDPDPELRKDLKELYENDGINSLREKLKIIDPEYYLEVDLYNPIRIIRALEVFYSTGEKYSELRKNESKTRHFNIIKFYIDYNRETLYDRINNRVDEMIREGLLEEAKTLYQYKSLTALKTVGYRELFDHFDGKYTLDEAIEKIKTNTRRYAKRQITWYKRDKDYIYVSPPDILGKIISKLKEKSN